MEEPIRIGALLCFILTNKKQLVGADMVEGSLACSDHEIVEFRTLRIKKKVTSKLTILDFKRADFGVFKNLIGRIPWNKALEGTDVQEHWLEFKNHLLQPQGWSIPMNWSMGKNTGRSSRMNKQLLTKPNIAPQPPIFYGGHQAGHQPDRKKI